MQDRAAPTLRRSALFVDFDAVYSKLAADDGQAARRFALHPQRWSRWLESLSLPREPAARRRILVRRCYLDPRRFEEYRPHFVRSAFAVVDSPAAGEPGDAGHGTGLLMALDLLEALDHRTRFDEFIVLSADAGLTPVLLRLREHDRRTVLLAAGPASPAYRSACDHLLSIESFVAEGLGLGGEATAPQPDATGDGDAPPGHPTDDGDLAHLLAAMAHRVHGEAVESGPLQPWQLPSLYKRFPEFTRGDDWLGFHSLRALTEAVVDTHGGLRLVDDEDWRVEAEAPPGAG